MPSLDTDWASFQADLDAMLTRFRRSGATHVNSLGDKNGCRDLVQHWFRTVRPGLLAYGIDESELAPLDAPMQSLLRLVGGRNRRSSYVAMLANARDHVRRLDVEREVAASRAVSLTGLSSEQHSPTERLILSTLTELVPAAGLSYQQALRDLADDTRVSFRGVANELRSVLWDVLDRLAPDKEVAAQPEFRLEKDRTKPTQRQKARHILRSRGASGATRKTAETTLEIIEESVGLLTRATYDRSSVSAHAATARAEVLQLRMYVDALLAELLSIHVQSGD